MIFKTKRQLANDNAELLNALEKYMTENTRMKNVLHEIAEKTLLGLSTDGGHHKQWYLEQIAADLRIKFDELPIEFEKGIAP
jgi:hypothetical protein